MCIAYKKHVKHAQVEPDLSSSVLERQSQTNIQSVSQRSPINLQIGLCSRGGMVSLLLWILVLTLDQGLTVG